MVELQRALRDREVPRQATSAGATRGGWPPAGGDGGGLPPTGVMAAGGPTPRRRAPCRAWSFARRASAAVTERRRRRASPRDRRPAAGARPRVASWRAATCGPPTAPPGGHHVPSDRGASWGRADTPPTPSRWSSQPRAGEGTAAPPLPLGPRRRPPDRPPLPAAPPAGAGMPPRAAQVRSRPRLRPTPPRVPPSSNGDPRAGASAPDERRRSAAAAPPTAVCARAARTATPAAARRERAPPPAGADAPLGSRPTSESVAAGGAVADGGDGLAASA